MNRLESRNPGVYLITNTVNGKTYVGSAAKNLRQRTDTHRTLLLRGRHTNIHLQRAWNKYKPEAFILSVLEECNSEDCLTREQWWMDRLDSYKTGYNRCPIAGSRKGTKHTEETKAKIAAKKVGVALSEETKQAMSEQRKGRQLSEEHRKRLKKAHWTKGPNAAEIAARIAAAHSGKPYSPERRANISAGRRRKFVS